MTKRRLAALLVCSLLSWAYGNTVMALMPVYMRRLGATPALSGNIMALSFVGLTLGTVSTGRLSTHLGRRRALYLVTCLVSIPATWLIGQVDAVWQLAILHTLVFTVGGGVTLTLIGIIAGLYADPCRRGQVFGLLALTGSLGGLFGGMVSGPIVDRWGFGVLFAVLAGFWAVEAVASRFLPDGPVAAKTGQDAIRLSANKTTPANVFYVLLAVTVLANVGWFVAVLGRSLTMNERGFAATAITLIAALSSATTLLINPLVGRLSDRVSRVVLLIANYTAAGLALALMAFAGSVVAFGFVAIAMALANARRAVESALVADLFPTSLLERRLSVFNAAGWVGGVIGLAGTGYAVQLLGLRAALLVGTLLPASAALLLALAVRTAARHGSAFARPVRQEACA